MKYPDGIRGELRSSGEPDPRQEQQTPAQQRVLRTAANGMQVWVPEDRLESWEMAQKDQSEEAKERRSRLASAIKSELLRLREQAQSR